MRLGDDRFVERLQSYVELRAGAAGAGGRRSTTWTCGSTNAVYVRPGRGDRRGAERSATSGPADDGRSRGTKRAVSRRPRRRHVEGAAGRRRDAGRRRPRRHRHRRGRVARHQARRRRQPRGRRRLDQEGDRRGRADGRRRDRLRPSRAVAARTSRASTAAAWLRSPARTARSRAKTCGARSTPPRPCRCRPAARSCTCCRRTSSSTSRTASARPSGMTGARLEVNVHIVTGADARRRTSWPA